MKIQEDLVWDKHTGELIGFVDLGDTDSNQATLQDVKELATHVLVFLIKSIVNQLPLLSALQHLLILVQPHTKILIYSGELFLF